SPGTAGIEGHVARSRRRPSGRRGLPAFAVLRGRGGRARRDKVRSWSSPSQCFQVAGQVLFQVGASTQRAHAGPTEAEAEHAGDLLVRQVAEILEVEDLAVLGVEPVERDLDRVPELLADEPGANLAHRRGDLACGVEPAGLTALGALPVADLVRRDREK